MISKIQLEEIVGIIKSLGVSDETVLVLRRQFAPIHFSYCMDDDLPNNKPVLEYDNFNVYLIDGREHCLCLTLDYEIATGIVVAEVYPD
ncbi:MAG: hypothetical protein D0531_04025 [Methylococcales bacterium]|nr:MAG: hypothetical protein D0531_04025 [Methylococcales bacterium]